MVAWFPMQMFASCEPIANLLASKGTASIRLSLEELTLEEVQRIELFLYKHREEVEKDPKLRDPRRSKRDISYPSELYELDQEILFFKRLALRIDNEKESLQPLRVEELLDFPVEENDFRSTNQIEKESAAVGRMAQILIETIQRHGIAPSEVLVRFFIPAREDLMRIHGTDRIGVEDKDPRLAFWDDQPEIRAFLDSRGLTYQDAIWAMPLNALNGSWISRFLSRRLSVAIYDSSYFSSHSGEYYVFNSAKKSREEQAAERAKALFGIVRSRWSESYVRQLIEKAKSESAKSIPR
jgi:hypothetical protein